MSSSSGGRLATSVRRFSASRTIATITPAHSALSRARRSDGVGGLAHAERLGPFVEAARRSASMRAAVASSGGISLRRAASIVIRLACADRLAAAIVFAAPVADRHGHRAQPLLELLVDQRPALLAHLGQLGAQRVGAT